LAEEASLQVWAYTIELVCWEFSAKKITQTPATPEERTREKKLNPSRFQ
jgi:hypothetical protein